MPARPLRESINLIAALCRAYADHNSADDSTFANKFGTKFNREVFGGHMPGIRTELTNIQPKVKKTTKRKV